MIEKNVSRLTGNLWKAENIIEFDGNGSLKCLKYVDSLGHGKIAQSAKG